MRKKGGGGKVKKRRGGGGSPPVQPALSRNRPGTASAALPKEEEREDIRQEGGKRKKVQGELPATAKSSPHHVSAFAFARTTGPIQKENEGGEGGKTRREVTSSSQHVLPTRSLSRCG